MKFAKLHPKHGLLQFEYNKERCTLKVIDGIGNDLMLKWPKKMSRLYFDYVMLDKAMEEEMKKCPMN
jgi:hypothetical protein